MTQQPELTKWSKGKPPMVGEYNASITENPGVRRWWNGEYWSVAYWPGFNSSMEQERRRRTKAPELQRKIQWRGLVDEPHYPFPPGPLEEL